MSMGHDWNTENQALFADVLEKVAVQMNHHLSLPHIIVGTDSQVHGQTTRFVTGVVITSSSYKRWTYTLRVTKPFKIRSIYSRLLYETLLTESLLSELYMAYRERVGIRFEAHLDISGSAQHDSSRYMEELRSRLNRVGFPTRIKPFAYVASCYANRYTK
ncbi:ribonuclease H-like YkuK family protein [Alkalihalobacillus sp. LMS6]|uniref:ribonuclease H-like YkuK family protein n=1 Tax=Alkalihalobacillus sp. LMS6 TaxID=2924034 RepID=UPI0020D1D8A7|nr:ribonuclease H-like YkuK family protein [Alkalihalobacillus sp. LMS6]UTR06703.1 ribonuclease H-like YkuK family protein [Alkalihalobacillus sp. LMS6]